MYFQSIIGYFFNCLDHANVSGKYIFFALLPLINKCLGASDKQPVKVVVCPFMNAVHPNRQDEPV